MNPLTLPPRLVIRAFDDLHAIALAARAVPDAVEILSEIVVVARRLEALDRRAAEVLERIDDVVAIAKRIEALDARAAAVLDRLASVDARAADVQALVDRLLISSDALGAAAGTLAQAVEPLQGVTERLGRVAERLPGARATRRSA